MLNTNKYGFERYKELIITHGLIMVNAFKGTFTN